MQFQTGRAASGTASESHAALWDPRMRSVRPQPPLRARKRWLAQAARAAAALRSTHGGRKKRYARYRLRKPSPESPALARRALACSASHAHAKLGRPAPRFELWDAGQVMAPEKQSTRGAHARCEDAPHPFERRPPPPAKSVPLQSAHSPEAAATKSPPACSSPTRTPPAPPKSRPRQRQNSPRSTRTTPRRPAHHTRREGPAPRESDSSLPFPL